MELLEVLTVMIVVLGAPYVVFAGIAKIRGAGGGGTEIRKSELEAMIRAAVDDAVPDIERRLQALEAIAIDEDLHQDRIDAALLADALDVDAADDAPAAVRRRARE